MSALAKALVAAQAEFPPIERSKDVRVQTKSGGSYSFSYAPLDAILHAVRPVLTKHGLAVSQLLGHVNGQPALKTVLLHEGGEVLEDACPLPANGALSAQEFGSLVTYFRRYALVTVLGIATEEDDDGNTASGNRVTSSAAESRPGTDDLGSAADAAAKAQAAYEQRETPTAGPGSMAVHFGKNKGLLLDTLTDRQLEWYATQWQIQDTPSAYDVALKEAAIALLAQRRDLEEIPFG